MFTLKPSTCHKHTGYDYKGSTDNSETICSQLCEWLKYQINELRSFEFGVDSKGKYLILKRGKISGFRYQETHRCGLDFTLPVNEPNNRQQASKEEARLILATASVLFRLMVRAKATRRINEALKEVELKATFRLRSEFKEDHKKLTVKLEKIKKKEAIA